MDNYNIIEVNYYFLTPKRMTNHEIPRFVKLNIDESCELIAMDYMAIPKSGDDKEMSDKRE